MGLVFLLLDSVGIDHPIGNSSGAAVGEFDEDVFRLPSAAKLSVGFGSLNLKIDRHRCRSNAMNPGGDLEFVSEPELCLVLDLKITDEPSESFVHEFLHGDPIAAFHLIEASG